ncbi:MAG TPA: fimbria/pilus periplasmic chaperone [Candidatus Baltobacteraceae bacterium]|nr:fimbria/pilus periplasmic chaperone [Candidatus Baltobacteraceae bacterium]
MRRTTLFVTAVAFFAAVACAAASTVSITPVKLTLAQSGSAEDLTVSNGNPEPTRFSVRAYKWTQSPSGEIQLAPSDDVIVYPQSFTVPALDRRILRVGFAHPLQPVEQTYRIVVSELPPFDETHPESVVRVLTKFSVPLFIAPPGGEAHPAIQNASLQNGKLTFALAVAGPVHVLATHLTVRGLDSNGKVVFEQTPAVWYVLPEQPRLYALTVPAGACARIAQLRFEATFDGAPPLNSSVAPTRAC